MNDQMRLAQEFADRKVRAFLDGQANCNKLQLGPDGEALFLKLGVKLVANEVSQWEFIPTSNNRLRWLVDQAKHDLVAYEVAQLLSAGCLRGKRPVPAILREFAADVVDGSLRKPKGRRGEKPKKNWARDLCICEIIFVLTEELGLFPTSNDEPKAGTNRRLSASEVVSIAFANNGEHGVTARTAKEVWKKKTPFQHYNNARAKLGRI